MKLRKLLAGMMLAAVAVTAAAPVSAAQPTIVSRAVAINASTGEFSTLLAAATCSYFDGAVVSVLSSKPQKTLFAPVDAAFATLGLTKDNVCAAFNGEVGSIGTPAGLLDILLYHVTPGRIPAGLIATQASLTQANGKEAAVSRIDGKLAVDGATIVIRNVPASNGFIHAVDTVLLP